MKTRDDTRPIRAPLSRNAGAIPSLILLSALVTTVLGCGILGQTPAGKAPGQQLERTSLKLGIPVISASLLPIYVAAQHTFEREGLNVEVVSFNGDSLAIQGLVAGAVDVNMCSVNGLVNAIHRGLDVKGFYAGLNQADLAWLARPNIKSWAELRGKSIGVTSFGSVSEVLTRHVLRRHSLDRGQPADVVAVGGPATALAALRAGTVDAVFLSPPFTWQAEQEGFVLLGSQEKEVSAEWPKGVFCAATRFVDENPNALRAFLRGHVSALRLAGADQPLTVAVLQQALKYEQPAAQRAYNEMMPGYDERGRLPARSMPVFWEVTLALGEVKEPWPDARLLDPRFVDTFDSWAPR